MNQWKITYFSPKLGNRSVLIEAHTEEEANKQFFDLILDGHSVGFCKVECLTAAI
jgi:hypothetical protein